MLPRPINPLSLTNLRKGRALYLLVALLAVFAFPVVAELLPRAETILRALGVVVVVAAVASVARTTHAAERILLIGLPVAATATSAMLAERHPWLGIAASLIVAAALGNCCFRGVIHLFRQRTVSADCLATALSAYLLLGLSFGFVFGAMESAFPGSFRVPEYIDSAQSAGHNGFIYLSFVTLTTLGYGDVTPTTPAAGSLAMLEAVLGQFYVAVVLARLVGLEVAAYLSQPKPASDEHD